MKFEKLANQYIDRLKTVLDAIDVVVFDRMVQAFLGAYERQARIFVMGNGGSGATASHMACDINKGCCIDLTNKFKMVCLNDNIPTMLALANDLSYDVVFEEQLKNQFTAGDMVLGISGSGNSDNVLRAIQYAAANDGQTIGWSGFGGGRLAELVDLALVVDSDDMQQVEDAHLIVAHMLMQAVHAALHDTTCSAA
ncbi:MAG: SIS domain-containing protein [Desulfobacteraceae bacterium]|jgi:D-sedoheptulose 7-phosphate isomerase